jgi:outer membrane receptor protein involved in Fe transport
MLSRRRVLSIGAALLSQLLVSGASAQEPQAAPPPQPPAAEPAAPAEEVVPAPAQGNKKEQTEDIVVTGSRIRRKDLTTPAPVTVINRDAITSSGKVSIGDFLQALPEQGNAINTAVNNGGDGATRVSLRSLGAQRTLVLINGRRMVAGGTGADVSVDLNSIPTAAIERVEVLKDGASAIYGSDAIGGVVNLITRKNWNGTDANVYLGDSGHNDAGALDVNVTTGTAGDRGSILFSAGFFGQKASMAGDRSFSQVQYGYDASLGQYTIGSSRTPGGRVRASGSGNAAFNALISNQGNLDAWGQFLGLGTPGAVGGPGQYLIHDSTMTTSTPNGGAGMAACLAAGGKQADCQWRPMDTSNTAGFGPGGSGDNYNFAPFNYLVTPQQRLSLWSSGDTRFGDVARGYFEASFVNRQSKQQLAPEPLIIGAGGVTGPDGLSPVSISQFNIYNPFGRDIGTASRRLDEFGFRTHKEDLNIYRVVLGLDGTLPDAFGPLKGWFWDGSFNYGRSYGTFTLGGSIQSSRLAAAIGPSMIDPATGQPVCVSVPGDITKAIGGCVPLDLFHGTGTITPDQVAPLVYTGTTQGSNSLQALQLNTSGELFSIPTATRPVGLGLGFEWRTVGGFVTQEPLTAKSDTSNGGAANTAGSYSVSEGYAELTIPIMNGQPYADDLEVQGAARIFDYNTFGTDWTYKMGARYRPIRDVTFRGTYSTAFRAPSVPDLYSGTFDNFPNVSDPCSAPTDPAVIARCNASPGAGGGAGTAGNGDDSTQLRARNGGSTDLKPETAKIFTVGLVFEPTFFRNFSATLDFYNVKIENSIQNLPESVILNGCYVTGTLGPSYCNGILREAGTHFITRIDNLTRNAGVETVQGIDLAMRYALPTPDFGRFAFTFDGTWLGKHDLLQPDGSLIKGRNTFDLQASSGQGGTNPEWKFNAGVLWGLKGFGAGATTKFIGGFHECGDSTGDFSGSGLCYIDSTYQRHVNAYNTYDAFVSYGFASVAGRTNVAFGVNNVFDTNPPKIYNTFASATDQYTYDQIGRFFYVRMNQTF